MFSFIHILYEKKKKKKMKGKKKKNKWIILTLSAENKSHA